MKRIANAAIVAAVLIGSGLVVHAATGVRLDMRPYTDAPAANHANRFDGFGYLASALLDEVEDEVDARLAAGATEPIDQMAAAAWTSVNQSPSTWRPYCVCVQPEGCPCKPFWEILSGLPPDELDRDVHQLMQAVPSQPPGRAQVLDAARANLTIVDMPAVARGYDDVVELVDRVGRGAMSRSGFEEQIELIEWSWGVSLRGDDRDFLLQTAAMARALVQYGGDRGRADQAPDWVDCAALGAAVGGWTGAVILGGGCATSALPWYPER